MTRNMERKQAEKQTLVEEEFIKVTEGETTQKVQSWKNSKEKDSETIQNMIYIIHMQNQIVENGAVRHNKATR